MECQKCGATWTHAGRFASPHKCDPNVLARLRNSPLSEHYPVQDPGPTVTLSPVTDKLNTVAECLASIVMGRLCLPSEHKKSTSIEDRIYIEDLIKRELMAAYNDGRKNK